MKQPRTIVLAYASVGSGHRIAAEALAAALEDREGEDVHVEIMDVLAYTKLRITGDRLADTFTGPTAGIYDWAWGNAGIGRMGRALGGGFLSWNYRAFERRVAELDPDAVICTHALPAALTARLVRKGHATYRVVSVATDFGVHGFWPRRGVALYCCADDASRDELISRGTQSETIAVTGIPVRPQFTLEYDLDAARRHFGLPSDKRVILALAGSTMPGPYEHLKNALAVSLPALASLPNTSVAIVTGQDDRYAEELRTRAAGFGTTNVLVLGYVERMAPLMATADLVLAKPGGMVCAECVAAGLPLVLVGPAIGQERANAEALTKAGAALYAADPRTVAEYARKAISKPARLAKLREGAQAVGRPFATSDITERIAALIGLA